MFPFAHFCFSLTSELERVSENIFSVLAEQATCSSQSHHVAVLLLGAVALLSLQSLIFVLFFVFYVIL